jgi:hypothetical protein
MNQPSQAPRDAAPEFDSEAPVARPAGSGGTEAFEGDGARTDSPGGAGEPIPSGGSDAGASLLDRLLAMPPGGGGRSGDLSAAGEAAVAGASRLPAASGEAGFAGAGGLPRATVGFCVDEHHPVLQGRVRVRWGVRADGGSGAEAEEVASEGADAEEAASKAAPAADPASGDPADGDEAWLPVLRGVTVRRRDRVLLVHPDGWDEPVVVGVVDGFRRREDVPVEGGPALELRRDEALTIRDAEGTPILRVRDLGEGPEIQLLSEASKVRLPGALDLSASEITLEARDGEVRIRANDDVVVRGEVIKLN